LFWRVFRDLSGHFRYSRRTGPQVLGHASQVLRRRGQQELVLSTIYPTQPQAVHLQHPLHVGELAAGVGPLRTTAVAGFSRPVKAISFFRFTVSGAEYGSLRANYAKSKAVLCPWTRLAPYPPVPQQGISPQVQKGSRSLAELAV